MVEARYFEVSLTRFVFADKLVTTVVDYALHANEADAGDAEVAHKLLRMNGTEIRILGHLVVLAGVLER